MTESRDQCKRNIITLLKRLGGRTQLQHVKPVFFLYYEPSRKTVRSRSEELSALLDEMKDAGMVNLKYDCEGLVTDIMLAGSRVEARNG